VCINQENDAEKAATMGVMDTIYKNARAVVVAMDDLLADEQEELFLRQYMDQYAACDLPMHQQPNLGMSPPFIERCPLLLSFFERLMGSTWFDRAWCAHELRMGRNIVFLVPSVSDR
jgi:hypothetical protein